MTVLAPTYTGPSEEAIRRDVERGIAHVVALALRRLRTWMAAVPAGPEGDAPRQRLTELGAAFERLDFDVMSESRGIIDTPDGCIERLHELRATLGADRVICWFNMGGLTPHHRVLETMTFFSDHVMPAFERSAVAA